MCIDDGCVAFTKRWAQTAWKMKSVYFSFAVHVFDWMTDVLVILQWLREEEVEDVDHIDTQIMAFCAIGVMAFSRLFSTFAIIISERNIRRSVFQFFDLLILEVELI